MDRSTSNKVYRTVEYGANQYMIYPPTWSVQSSRGVRTYTVSVDPATRLYTCTCPDHQYRQRDCSHIRKIQRSEGGKPHVRVIVGPRGQQPPATVSGFEMDALFSR